MSGIVTCPACRVALPERVGKCPACGARFKRSRGQNVARLAVTGILSILMVVGLVLSWLSWPQPAWKKDVFAYVTASRLSTNFRQTDVIGYIESKATFPVDMTVRFQVRDAKGNVLAIVDSGLYRNLPPGTTRPIKAVFDMTPVHEVTVDIINVTPTPP